MKTNLYTPHRRPGTSAGATITLHRDRIHSAPVKRSQEFILKIPKSAIGQAYGCPLGGWFITLRHGLCTADVLLRIDSHHHSLILAGILDNLVCTSTSLEGQITNAYPHVVMDRIGDGGGKTDPEDRLGHHQRVYVPVASEKFAENQPTD
jgi:hypothetical protein